MGVMCLGLVCRWRRCSEARARALANQILPDVPLSGGGQAARAARATVWFAVLVLGDTAVIPSYLSHCIQCALGGIRPDDALDFYRAAVRVLRGRR